MITGAVQRQRGRHERGRDKHQGQREIVEAQRIKNKAAIREIRATQDDWQPEKR